MDAYHIHDRLRTRLRSDYYDGIFPHNRSSSQTTDLSTAPDCYGSLFFVEVVDSFGCAAVVTSCCFTRLDEPNRKTSTREGKRKEKLSHTLHQIVCLEVEWNR